MCSIQIQPQKMLHTKESSGTQKMLDIEESSGTQKMLDKEESSGAQEVDLLPYDFDFNSLSDAKKLEVVECMVKVMRMLLPPGCPLFELFSVRVELYDESENQCELYGFIEAQDGGDCVYYLDSDDEIGSQSICKNAFVSLIGPDRCVSASGDLVLEVELYVKVKGEEEELELCFKLVPWNFNRPRYRDLYDDCRTVVTGSKLGRVTFYYVALRRAVQATVEATLEALNGDLLDGYGRIVAYYGDFDYRVEPHEKEFYQVTLLDRSKMELKNGGIPLSRSVLAVPSESSLVIKANFWDFESKDDEILSGTFTFPFQSENSSIGLIESQLFRINLKVDWECNNET